MPDPSTESSLSSWQSFHQHAVTNVWVLLLPSEKQGPSPQRLVPPPMEESVSENDHGVESGCWEVPREADGNLVGGVNGLGAAGSLWPVPISREWVGSPSSCD